MQPKEYQHIDVTRSIIGCAMKVHSYFGMGFPEVVYKRALLIELEENGLQCKAEVEKDIYYRGNFIGKRRLGLIVENKVLVELKAIKEIDITYYNQILNYLKIFELEIGLLLNFGSISLQFKRFAFTEDNLRNHQ